MVTAAGALMVLLIVGAAVAGAAAAVVGLALGALADLTTALAGIIERVRR